MKTIEILPSIRILNISAEKEQEIIQNPNVYLEDFKLSDYRVNFRSRLNKKLHLFKWEGILKYKQQSYEFDFWFYIVLSPDAEFEHFDYVQKYRGLQFIFENQIKTEPIYLKLPTWESIEKHRNERNPKGELR